MPSRLVNDPVATFLTMNSIGIISTNLMICSLIFSLLTKWFFIPIWDKFVRINPIITGQLSREEISLSSEDENRPLKIKSTDVEISNSEKKIKKYIPLSKRQDKPDSALWLLRQHSLLKDSQIAKLVGITKNSVTSIRNKSYWNYNNLNSKDPVALNLFTQKNLIEAIEKAERRIKREKKEKEKQQKAQQANN